MKTYDISIPIKPDMPVWPGDPRPKIERVEDIEAGDEVNISQLSMGVHTGTHVDAPFHFLKEGSKLDEMPLNLMFGRAYVLHLPNVDLITAEVLTQAEIPPRTRRVLFKTRNSDYWARGETEFQPDFVALSADGAQYMADRKVKLVGIDYLSIGPFENVRPTHEILLKAEIMILEGLNLSEVSQGRYTFYCLPLRLQGVDGAPARAILIGV